MSEPDLTFRRAGETLTHEIIKAMSVKLPLKLKKRVVFAIGDSWFATWPDNNIAGQLTMKHYEVHSQALKGTTLSLLSAPGGQLEWLVEQILGLSEIGKNQTKGILFSCIANDVVDDETNKDALASLLNQASPGQSPLNEAAVADTIDKRLRDQLEKALAAIIEACKQNGNWKVPILIHGYDYPVPDKLGHFKWLSGPLESKGYSGIETWKGIMKQLIDRLNEMQIRLIEDEYFSQVEHIDLRGVLSTDLQEYKKFWNDELHPTDDKGYPLVAEKFDRALNGIFDK